jgi:hypothetical protein
MAQMCTELSLFDATEIQQDLFRFEKGDCLLFIRFPSVSIGAICEPSELSNKKCYLR